jgi:hypothetical protein
MMRSRDSIAANQIRNDNMPLIQVSVIKGVFSPEQSRR